MIVKKGLKIDQFLCLNNKPGLSRVGIRFLIGIVLLIFGFGIYELFVSEIDSSGNWQGLMSSTTPASNWQVFVKSMEVNSQGDVHLAGGLYGGDFTFAGGNVDVFYNSGSTVAESFLFKFNFNVSFKYISIAEA